MSLYAGDRENVWNDKMNRISRNAVLGALAAVILIVVLAAQFLGGGLPDPSSGDVSQRIDAIGEIAAEGSRDAGETIASVAVKDRDPQVRCVAMVSLRKYARPENRAAIEQGTKDEASRVRAAAAVTLGKYADGEAVERLGELLKTDQHDEVRLAAALALARCNSRKGDDMLVSAMKGNSSQVVQKRSMLLLLRGTGVSLAPEPDPRNAGVWTRHMERVLRHVNADRTAESSRPRTGGGKEK